jgi:hypothetical protein
MANKPTETELRVMRHPILHMPRMADTGGNRPRIREAVAGHWIQPVNYTAEAHKAGRPRNYQTAGSALPRSAYPSMPQKLNLHAKNGKNSLLDGGDFFYRGFGWKQRGSIANGVGPKELGPGGNSWGGGSKERGA